MARSVLPSVIANALDRIRATLAPIAVVICHCHYEDLVPELIECLDRLPGGCAVHISSSNTQVFRRWNEVWRRKDQRLTFHVVENRGRDIRPFFEIVNGLRVRDSVPILKIHGKKSIYTPRGDTWRRDMLDSLLPDRATALYVAQRFRSEVDLGMVGPERSYTGRQVYWGANRNFVEAFLEGVTGFRPSSDDLGFYAGSMFWISASLARRLGQRVDLDLFPPEANERDGTYAHALERAIPMAARSLGLLLFEMNSTEPMEPAVTGDREVPYI